MSKIFRGISLFFFLFWIIYAANKGKPNMFIEFANSIYYGDKIGHFFLFGILTFCFNLALKYKRIKFWTNIPLGTVLVSVFVIVEELSQAFIPKRSLDIIDLTADALGILCFTLIGNFLFKKGYFGLKK